MLNQEREKPVRRGLVVKQRLMTSCARGRRGQNLVSLEDFGGSKIKFYFFLFLILKTATFVPFYLMRGFFLGMDLDPKTNKVGVIQIGGPF